jgi:hypothetical protein
LISTGLFLLVKDESFNGFHELGKVLVSTDFSESIFRSQDSGNAPAMPHVTSLLTLNDTPIEPGAEAYTLELFCHRWGSSRVLRIPVSIFRDELVTKLPI